MCDYDEFIFDCGHSVCRLKCYCHKARNHPFHECHFVKKLRSCWDQGRECDDCAEERRRREAEWAFYYSQQGQGQG